MGKSQEVSPFPAGDHKAARNREDSIARKDNTKFKLQKGSTEAPPWNGQQKIMEVLNMFNGTNITLNSDLDQET